LSFQIVAIAARKQEDADQFAAKHKIATAYASYDSIATDPNIGWIGRFAFNVL